MSWKTCKDCFKERKPFVTNEILSSGSQLRELYGTLELLLCDKCSAITPCSVCNTISNTTDLSNWNQKPICTTCKDIQCYRCGEEGYEKTWYGWIMCEECAMELCNKCGGECENPCSNCERPCDNCSCSSESE